ncbi:MAG: GYF domain-containing protein [Puniceicoccales bacterium]|jgi:hypothetical protein|nr:GYF domain-containing protein [Puniceicoccales bacterium]
MNPRSSRQYAFFINDKVEGPYSQVEADARVAASEITAETQCSIIGIEGWHPASAFFIFPESKANAAPRVVASLRDQRVNRDEEKPTLDLKLRQKIIQYGLATAASAEELTPLQAEAALRNYEEQKRKDKRQKTNGAILSGVLSVLGTFLFGLTSPGQSFSNFVAAKFISTPKIFQQTQQVVSRELRYADKALNDVRDVTLNLPRGARPKDFFAKRVSIPYAKASLLDFRVDTSKLVQISKAKPYIVYLKRLDSEDRKNMVRQAGIVWKYKNPSELAEPLESAELEASWALYKKQEAEKNATFLRENENARLSEIKPGVAMRIPGLRPDYMALVVDVDGMLVCFPCNAQEIVRFSNVSLHKMTLEEAFEAEYYVVKQKREVGGHSFGTKVSFQGKEYFLKREKPLLRYLAMSRPEVDPKSLVWVLITDKGEYDKAEVDVTRYTTKTLVDYTSYASPQELQLRGNVSEWK